jgi:hypothetical protein
MARPGPGGDARLGEPDRLTLMMPGQRNSDRDRCGQEQNPDDDGRGANPGHAAQLTQATKNGRQSPGRRLARLARGAQRHPDRRSLPVRLGRFGDRYRQLAGQRPDRHRTQPVRKHHVTGPAAERRTGS